MMKPKGFSVSDLFAIKLYDNIESQVYGPPERWRASSLASCPRAQYFKRKGVEPLRKLTKARELRNQAGHYMEAAIRESLKRIYPNLVSNVRFKNEELNLGGELDNYDPDSKQLIEIKTIGVRAPRYRRVAEDRHHLKEDGPYLHHELQQHVYTKLMHHPETEVTKNEDGSYQLLVDWSAKIGGKFEVERISYVYITLEGLIITYTTEVKPEVVAMVDKRLSILNEAWDTQTPPVCLCHDLSHPLWPGQMRWCDYRKDTSKPVDDPHCCDLNLMKEK